MPRASSVPLKYAIELAETADQRAEVGIRALHGAQPASLQRLRACFDETLPRRSGGPDVGRSERHDAVLAVHGLPQQEELLRAHRELAFSH